MKKWMKSLALVMGLSSVLVLGGCSTSKDAKKSDDKAKQEFVLPTKDRAGDDIKIPEKASKIVSLVPSVTQVIDELGDKDLLIGVDNQSMNSTEGVDKLPQFDMMSVDAEKLIALKPEMVYISDLNKQSAESVWKQVKDAGITVIDIPTSTSIDAIEKDVQFIADTLSKPEEGKKLVDTMESEIEEVKTIGSKIDKKKKVLFEIAAAPDIYSFGSGVFLNEMIETIGAENVLADQKGWVPVTQEAAIASKPDAILTSVNYTKDPVGDILNAKGWEQVPAVKNKAVYQIDTNSSTLPNNHITKALKQMAKSVYPDEYKDLKND